MTVLERTGTTGPDLRTTGSAREKRLITAATVVLVVGMMISFKLTGRFAVSNVAQAVALGLLLSAHPRLLRPRDVGLFLLALGSVAAAAYSVSALYGYVIQVEHTLFFALFGLHLVAVYRLCHDHGQGAAFAEGLRRAIPVALVLVVLLLAVDLASGDARRRLGFDDKSHAAVALCFLSFASLRFLRTPLRIIISLAFFVISLLTISRLPYLFTPAYLIAFVLEYRRIRSYAVQAWQVYGVHLVLLTAVCAPVVVTVRAGHYFDSFRRVFEQNDVTNRSNDAHLLLLGYAGQVKVENVWNFLLGVTPGGFSGVTYRSDVDVGEFAVADPAGFRKFVTGEAPMHSTVGSVILEFPLWIALVFLALVVVTFIRLARRRETAMWLYAASLLGASVFYSSHNEVHYIASWTALIAVAFSRPPFSDQDRPIRTGAA
ncbi:hypothetical protein [Promicromonospora sp. NPDC050262]|uniref:hypothetical protein n=1 Tax=Promicromonospora sp. NPDC050262 TaxID=3155036 RepID=UPI0033C13362